MIILLRIPVKHGLPIVDVMIYLDAVQRIVIRRRDRGCCGYSGDRRNLRQPRRIYEEILPFSKAFYRAKGEKPISNDPAAHGSAELFAIIFGLGVRRLFFKEVPRANRLVAEIQKARPVEVVGSGLGDHVNHAAHGSTAFCRPAVLQHLELLNSFVGKVLEQTADHVIFVIATIHVHIQLPAVAPIHGNVSDASLGRIETTRGTRFGHNGRQIGKCAIQERQILNLVRCDDAAKL